MAQSYAITLTKIVPGEPTGQIPDLLEDWGFNSLDSAMRRFKEVQLNKTYVRKELWVKDTDTKIKKIIKEERYHA